MRRSASDMTGSKTNAVNKQSVSGEMVSIPAGKMTMGAMDGAPDEQKMHDVKILGILDGQDRGDRMSSLRAS